MRISLTFILVLLTIISAVGQIEATTKEGRKVVLNNDGTWKYQGDTEVASQKLPDNVEDCSNWISTTEDKVSGSKTTGAKESLVISDDGGETGLGIYWLLSGKNPILSIIAVGASGCIDDKSKINILFKDGTRLELITNTDFNCNGKATTYFLGMFGKKPQLEMLTSKKIETMRVWTSKSYVEKNFDDYQAEAFMRTGKCLFDLAR